MNELFFNSAEAFGIPQRIIEVLVHALGVIEQLCYQLQGLPASFFTGDQRVAQILLLYASIVNNRIGIQSYILTNQ
jgi:hypothetical protein